MRYDKVITPCEENRGLYNEDTGDYDDVGDIYNEPIIASVCDASDQTVKLVYGEMREGVLMIHVPTNDIDIKTDYILYKGKKYRIDKRRNLRFKTTFIVSEVH
ncbi:MAG: hypothetical protein HXL87_04925 [[Eubacterium] sulci]|nr:hypothetical protein [[Eubacterium] sulci]